jgi:hypothetical protein
VIVELPTQPMGGVEALRWSQTHAQTVTNVVRLRPYVGYSIEGIHYTIDVFNPRGELGVAYTGAGETVVVLMMQSADPPAVGPRRIRDRLVENGAFYEILKDIDGILSPRAVRGTYSLLSVLMAYVEGRLGLHWRPWDLLFPLHVLEKPPANLTTKTPFPGGPVGMMADRECTLAKVDDWSRGRALIQVRPGLDQDVAWEYFAVAKGLGMVPVQQLVDGAVV